jgi:hypothetical protein
VPIDVGLARLRIDVVPNVHVGVVSRFNLGSQLATPAVAGARWRSTATDGTTRDRAANVRLYRLAAEILAAVEAGVFPPRVGWHCQDWPVRSRCWVWG